MNRRRRAAQRQASSDSARNGTEQPVDLGAWWGLDTEGDPGVDGGASGGAGGAGSAGVGVGLIRPNPEPGSLPRSLGDPPLAVRPGLAEAHLVAVYEEAVRAATALAAVNGLLAADSSTDGG